MITDPDENELPNDWSPETAAELGIDVDEFAGEADAKPTTPSTDPATDAIGFYDASPDAHALDGVHFDGQPGVLERLGPAHFRSKGFSFMGFLQTVYDHVAAQTGGKAHDDDASEVR